MKNKFETLRDEAIKILKDKNISINSLPSYPDIDMFTHCKMVQGPWQALGITIDRLIDTAIRHELWIDNIGYDYNYELPIEESIETAKTLCNNFFDSFQKEFENEACTYFQKIIKEHKKNENP